MRSYEIAKLDLAESGQLQEQLVTLDAPETSVPDPTEHTFPKEFYNILGQIDNEPKTIKDPRSGKQFEAILVNPDQKHKGVTVSIGTYSSSMSGNPGNVAEEAMRSIFANDTRLYIAPFGNGYSTPLTNEELAHFSAFGQFGSSDTIRALARALEAKQTKEDFEVKRFSTDSFGGYIALSLASHMDTDQIDSMFIKGKPGVSHFSLPRMAYRMILRENLRNLWNYKFGGSYDPWRITPAMMDMVKSKVPSLYAPGSKDFVHQGSKDQLLAYGRGMSRVSKGDDLMWAMGKQHGIKLTFDMPTKDLLYKSKDDIESYIKKAEDMSQSCGGRVPEFYRSPGGHGAHATQPLLRAAVEKQAFRTNFIGRKVLDFS